ncbi:MAG: hypothetical protein J6R06_08255 [Bacteroidales bacterium]|nr:hypothetical protein [Bacteroidales bacterium]
MKFADLNRKPLEYRKLADMTEALGLTEQHPDYGTTTPPVQVKSLWISLSSEYREDKKSAVAELGGDFEGVALNLPPHMIPVVEDILRDGESLSMIARGKVGLAFYEYENKFGMQTGAFWVDLK